MLLGLIFLGVYTVCTLYALISGNAAAAGAAVMNGAQEAVLFCVKIAGGLCLWSAVLELMEQSGIAAGLARLLRPLLKRMFPRASDDSAILSALSENVSANLLGLGNAATPSGIRAAKGIAALNGGKASDELCLLVVLNTASIQLIPTGIAAVRSAAGAVSAFDIMPAVWISSAISLTAGLSAAAFLKKVWK